MMASQKASEADIQHMEMMQSKDLSEAFQKITEEKRPVDAALYLKALGYIEK